MKNDILKFVKDFHSNAFLTKAVTSSFLTLIPKVTQPSNLEDYIHICLVGCLYKIITKLLAVRLKRVLGGLISHCQSMFVLGRQLLDGVLIANEIVDLDTINKKRSVMFKVDFEKAYNCVN